MLKRIVQGKVSSWLLVFPTVKNRIDVSVQQFRNRVAERYGKEPTKLEAECDGCGKKLSLPHALDCKKKQDWCRRVMTP